MFGTTVVRLRQMKANSHLTMPIAVLVGFVLFFGCIFGLAMEEVVGPSHSLVRQFWLSLAATVSLAALRLLLPVAAPCARAWPTPNRQLRLGFAANPVICGRHVALDYNLSAKSATEAMAALSRCLEKYRHECAKPARCSQPPLRRPGGGF